MKTVTIVDGVEMTRELWAKKITESWQKSIESILETGRNLTHAKGGLEHGEWMQMTKSELPFSHSTANRLMAIAENPILSNCAHARNLPTSWMTLSELTKLEPKLLEKKIEAGEINPATQRKDVTAMLNLPNSARSKGKLERIEKERPDLYEQIKAGKMSMSMADTIIARDKKSGEKAPQFQGKPSEHAENAASELAEILIAYCDENGVPRETIYSYLEECNNEQIIAVMKHGSAAAAVKRSVKTVLRHVVKEFGKANFEGAALAIMKEGKVPFEKLGDLAEAQKAAKKAKGGKPLTDEERNKIADKINRPSKSGNEERKAS